MKKIVIFFLGIIIPLISEAENTLSITNTTVESNKSFDLDINLKNTDNISALQFDINLDLTQFSLVDGSSLVESRTDDHQLSVSQVSNTKIRVLLFSSTNKNLVKGDGKLVSLSLKSKNEPTSYSVSFSDIIGSNADGETVEVGSSSGTITLKAPKMVINSSNINFDRVPLGDTKQISFSINNQGNDDLEVTGLKNTISPFEVDTDFPFTLSAGSSKSISISFKSETKGTYSATLQLNSNEPEPNRANHKVNLSSISYAVNELRVGSHSGYSNKPVEIKMKINNMEKFNGFQFDVTIPNGFEYVTSSEKYLGREVDHKLGVAQNSNKLTFIGYSDKNSNFTGDDGDILSFEIKGNIQYGTYTLNVSNAIITDSTSLNILSDSYNGSIQIYSPRINLSSTSINFGDVSILEDYTRELNIRNYGNDTLKISSWSFEDSDLSWNQESDFFILNNQSKNATITFDPQKSGVFSSKLSIRHNDPDQVSTVSFSANVYSPNYFKVKNTKAEINTTATIPIILINNDDVTGFQFDIEQPQHLEFDMENMSLSSRKVDHSITYSKLSNTSYRIIAYSPTNKTFTGNDNVILNIPTKISSSATVGAQINLSFSNIIISDINSKNIVSPAFDSGTITIAKNNPPTSENISVTTNEDTSKEITLKGSDIDGDVLTYSIVSEPTNGTVTVSGSNATYTPSDDYNGSDSFTYKANDGTDDSNTATVSITITAVNDAPVFLEESYTFEVSEATEKESTIGMVESSDIDNSSLSYEIIQENTPFTVDDNGKITLSELVDYETKTSHQLEIKVSDGELSDTTLVTISIIDEKPKLSLSTSSIDLGVVENNNEYTVNFTVLNEGKDTLFITNISSNLSDKVAITLEEGDFILPNSGESFMVVYNPIEILSEEGFFSISDNNNETHTIQFKAEVLAENYLYFETINPFPGDKDTLNFILRNPNSVIGFQLDILNDENIEFLIDDIFLSERKDDHSISASTINDTITRIISYSLQSSPYKQSDGVLFSLPFTVKSDAQASINTVINKKMVLSSVAGDNIAQELKNLGSIKIGNFTPIANADTYSLNEDSVLEVVIIDGILNNDTDIENDNITAVLSKDVSNGTLDLNGDGSFTYTPNQNYFGDDSFTYSARDDYSESEEVEVSISINPVNDAPVSEDVDTITTTGSTLTLTLPSEDVDSDILTFSLIQVPVNGEASLDNNLLTYTPNPGYYGLDSIIFIVSDGAESSSLHTVRIKVNDVPISNEISLETLEDEAIIIEFDVIDNFGTIENYKIITDPLNGSLSSQSGNQITYTPQENYYGADSLFYSAIDSYGAESNVAKVLIDIDSVYDVPSVNITLIDSEIDESGGSTSLLATLDGVDAGDAEVNIEFSITGTASSSDFTISESLVTIPKLSTEKEVVISSVDDAQNEEDETIIITIGDVSNASISGSESFQITIIDDDLPLGMEKEDLIKRIYPNPINDKVTIELRKNRKIYGVKIYDFSGKHVQSVKGNKSSAMTISLDDLYEGIYVLNVETKFENIIKKIIITNQ